MDDQRVCEGENGELMNNLLTAVSDLIESLADTVSRDRGVAQERVRQAREALLTCTRAASQSSQPKIADLRSSPGSGCGLAPWQIRNLRTHIETHLHTSLSCEALACRVGLSVSYFTRVFKCSFGCSPHRFLMRSRVKRAQRLMLKSGTSLAQISVECGLADQAHLSRVFRQFTGESPASWRRARVTEPEAVRLAGCPDPDGAGILVYRKINNLRARGQMA